MDEGPSYDLADQKAIQAAIKASQRLGPSTCVPWWGAGLRGSEDNWSDLNLWLLVTARTFPKRNASSTGDGLAEAALGDTAAHASFHAIEDVTTRLNAWDDEQLWFLNSHILYGPYERVAEIKRRFATSSTQRARAQVSWFMAGTSIHWMGSTWRRGG